MSNTKPRMKTLRLLSVAALLIGACAINLNAGQQRTAVDPQATNDGIHLREIANAADANFSELYAGAGTAETVTYASTTNLDFAKANFKTVTLTGGVTFTTSNLVPGKRVDVRLTGGGSGRALTFPAGWVFVGAAAPSALTASKTGLLVLRSYGTTDANIVASYQEQP